jgi:hypothetical protein
VRLVTPVERTEVTLISGRRVHVALPFEDTVARLRGTEWSRRNTEIGVCQRTGARVRRMAENAREVLDVVRNAR